MTGGTPPSSVIVTTLLLFLTVRLTLPNPNYSGLNPSHTANTDQKKSIIVAAKAVMQGIVLNALWCISSDDLLVLMRQWSVTVYQY